MAGRGGGAEGLFLHRAVEQRGRCGRFFNLPAGERLDRGQELAEEGGGVAGELAGAGARADGGDWAKARSEGART